MRVHNTRTQRNINPMEASLGPRSDVHNKQMFILSGRNFVHNKQTWLYNYPSQRRSGYLDAHALVQDSRVAYRVLR